MIPVTFCPAPKPRKSRKRAPKPMQRTRFKARGKRTKKSGGALFWKVKDRAFRRWLRTTQRCLLWDVILPHRLTLRDLPLGLAWRGVAHRCWGAITPAHVGKHQAHGAPDLGACVPLCQAAHQFYDEHRRAWASATGYTEDDMEKAAEHYGAAYVAQQGGEIP